MLLLLVSNDLAPLLAQTPAQAPRSAKPAFRIGRDETNIDDLMQQRAREFYDIELKRQQIVERLAREQYLESFWRRLAEREHLSAEEARKKYLGTRLRLNEAEIQATIERFKGQPRFQELKESERRAHATEYLEGVRSRELIEQIVQAALRNRELVVLYPKPVEPVFELSVNEQADAARYSPPGEDNSPSSCRDKGCLTIVEYGEYQCPLTRRSQAALARVLAEYRGRIRLVTRDFPLGFHARSRVAAIAAKCAGAQSKFWPMHDTLLENQRALGDEHIASYAKALGLDLVAFESCRANPAPLHAAIDLDFRSGEALGVSATPTYFVGGRRLEGVQTTESLRRAVEEELIKQRRGQR